MRIYWQTVLKKALGIGVPVGIAGFALIFIYLNSLGVIEITGHSGDSFCAGIELDPCYAYINFTAKEDIFIYPTNYDPWGRDTPFETDKGLKSWKIYRSWGKSWREIKLNETCKYTWCGAPPNSPDNKYAFAFRKNRDYQIRIVAYKNDPSEDIKWSFTNELDPTWFGEARDIGYEFINDSVHIWNTQDDYFFDKNSGIQLTNHYEDYWSKNIFCIGYYSGEEWIKIKCADELTNFNKNIQTDNLTYVNATLWKDFSYSNYDIRLGVRYHLGLDDKNLSITVYGKNIGIDIPYDLGFAWKVKDLNVPPETTDKILINNTNYELDGNYNLLFKDMKKEIESCFSTNETTSNGTIIYNCSTIEVPIPFYKVYDYDSGLTGKENFLRIDWNEDLNYAIRMYGNGNQSDFYTALLVNAGHFSSGQEKSTTFYWIDALIDDIVSYYKLDDDAANTDVDDSVDANEGTLVGGETTAGVSVDGKINTAFEFDGNDYINPGTMGTLGSDLGNGISISFWIKTTASTLQIPMGTANDGLNTYIYFAINSDSAGATDAGKLFFLFRDEDDYGTGGATTDDVNFRDGAWHHIVLTLNGATNTLQIYVDNDSKPVSYFEQQTADNFANFQYPLAIGARNYQGTLGVWYVGNLDEFGIWNKILSPAEVTTLWNGGDGFTYPFIETIPPTYSNNQTNTTEVGTSCLFSILYDDNTALEPTGQYIFSTNNTGTWTNESAVNFTATPEWANVTKTLNDTVGISIGYRWFADDNAGNINNTPIYTLTTTDTTAPVVTLNLPVDNYNSSSQDITFNGTVSDNVDIANVSLYGNWTGIWLLNETNSSGINNVDYIFTKTISSGLGYIWNYYACDSLNNCNFSAANRTFNIDTVAPIINVQSPINTTYATSTIYFNATADEAIDTWIVNYNSTNVTHTINTTLTVEDGFHHLLFYGNDSFGNWGVNDSIYFSVDATYPLLNITYPANNSYIDTTWINITGTASDTNPDTVWINDTNFGTNLGTYTNWNFTNTSIAEGSYSVQVSANDTVNNTNSSVLHFVIDRTNPSIYYNPNTDSGYVGRDWIFVNVTATDTNLDSVRLEWNGTNETFDNSGNSFYWENQTSLSDGNYTFYAWANDSAGNYNSTSTRNVAVDTTAPLINITYPLNITYDYPNPKYLNYTVSDAGVGLDSCWYSTNNGVTNTSITCGINITDLIVKEDSSNTWTIWANDSFGYENSSTVTFYSKTPYFDFNISITTNTTLDFHPDNNTHLGVAAENQTDSIGVFTANNNLTVAINVSAKLNETNANITLKLGNSSNYSLSIAITTSYQIIYANLINGSTVYLWAWADYDNPIRLWFPELEIKGINMTNG